MPLTESDWLRIYKEVRNELLHLARERLWPKLAARVSPESIVQETLLEAFLGRADFHGETDEEVRAFLRVALNNNILDKHRKHLCKKRDVRRDEPLAEPGSSAPGEFRVPSHSDPERQAQAREQLRRVLAAFEALPPAERKVMELVKFSNLLTKDVAAQLGKTDGAVRRLNFQGAKRLRENFNGSSNDEG